MNDESLDNIMTLLEVAMHEGTIKGYRKARSIIANIEYQGKMDQWNKCRGCSTMKNKDLCQFPDMNFCLQCEHMPREVK